MSSSYRKSFYHGFLVDICGRRWFGVGVARRVTICRPFTMHNDMQNGCGNINCWCWKENPIPFLQPKKHFSSLVNQKPATKKKCLHFGVKLSHSTVWDWRQKKSCSAIQTWRVGCFSNWKNLHTNSNPIKIFIADFFYSLWSGDHSDSEGFFDRTEPCLVKFAFWVAIFMHLTWTPFFYTKHNFLPILTSLQSLAHDLFAFRGIHQLKLSTEYVKWEKKSSKGLHFLLILPQIDLQSWQGTHWNSKVLSILLFQLST